MALNIVRHDITRIKADAIVNSTNEHLSAGGLGVDASIHYAAGPGLQEVLNEIGFCPVGSSVVTESFNIQTCKYIDQVKDLLLRAGMAFSKHYPADNLVESSIRNRMYNIDEINMRLYSMDLMVLGYSKGE